MGPVQVELPGLPPKQRKVKAYQVLGDVTEYQERLASTLPPPQAPPPPDVFTIQDTSEFPPDVWFAATISPDNGVAFIEAYRDLCKARALYQQQLTNIHNARKQTGMLSSTLSSSTVTSNGETPVNRTIAETLCAGAETRRLGKFEQQQARWDEVTIGLVNRTGRPPQELAMNRGPAWRTRAELTELLYRAQPRDARGLNPDEVFLTSLRDAWERVIPVGSIFSGLAVHIKDKPHELPETRAIRIGRPLDPLAPPSGGTTSSWLSGASGQGQGDSLQRPRSLAALPQQGQVAGQAQSVLGSSGGLGRPPVPRSLSARGRAWEDSELLQHRVNEYGSRLRNLAPHDPDWGSLVVAGEALEGQLGALAAAPISLTEVEAAVRAANPAAYEAYRAVKDEMEAQLRAALEAEEAARASAEAAAAAAAPLPGPHATLSPPSLSLACHSGETSASTVTLSSKGTAAVWWSWERRPPAQHMHAATEQAAPRRFIASQQSGMLLPGQSLALTITFVAGPAGTFRETWELVTRPPLQGPSPRLQLHLRGMAEVRDASAVGRTALDASLAQREKTAKVAAAAERLLREVRMPRRMLSHEPAEELAAADVWDVANGCGVEGGPYVWPPVFYWPGVQTELSDVYREANSALVVAMTPVVEEDTKKKRKDSHRPGKKVEEPPPPPPKYPPLWHPPQLTTLEALLAELSTVAPAIAAPLAARAEATKARALVAPSSRRLVRRAIRVMVCKMVDGMEERLGSIRADLEAKHKAELEATAAATAAAAAATGAAVASEASSGHGGEGMGGEASSLSVASHKSVKTPQKGAKGAALKGKGAAAGAGAGDAAPAGPVVIPLEALQPAFHEKAASATKSVIKAALNSVMDEIQRHKVAVGDALEASIRNVDQQIAAEQSRLLRAQQPQASPRTSSSSGKAHTADAEASTAGVATTASQVAAAAVASSVDWYVSPSGGVPAPCPGPPAAVRSPALESLYWERLCVLRTWTSLGIPNRGDIR